MADKEVNGLLPITALEGDDKFPVFDDSEVGIEKLKHITVANLKTNLGLDYVPGTGVLTLGPPPATTKFVLDTQNHTFDMELNGLKTFYWDTQYLFFGLDDGDTDGLWWEIDPPNTTFDLRANNNTILFSDYNGTTLRGDGTVNLNLRPSVPQAILYVGGQIAKFGIDLVDIGNDSIAKLNINATGSLLSGPAAILEAEGTAQLTIFDDTVIIGNQSNFRAVLWSTNTTVTQGPDTIFAVLLENSGQDQLLAMIDDRVNTGNDNARCYVGPSLNSTGKQARMVCETYSSNYSNLEAVSFQVGVSDRVSILASGLALENGARVDTIETTLNNDDTHIPTSGAVIGGIEIYVPINISVGTGSPEGVVSGTPGDLYFDTIGGSGATQYVKETGTGITGWAVK